MSPRYYHNWNPAAAPTSANRHAIDAEPSQTAAPGAFQTRRLTLAVDTPLDELGASRSKTPMPSSPPAETRQDFPRGDRSTPSTRDDALT